jgi:membrane protein implicated in regulation of membrane protease activity
MLALGLASAALAAHLNLSLSSQIVMAAMVGLGAVLALYARRKQFAGTQSDTENRASDLDAGQTVQIQADQLTPQGATVVYRGSQWVAQSTQGSPLTVGPYRIVRVDGSRLLLEPV